MASPASAAASDRECGSSRCTCSSARMTGAMKATKKSRPGVSNCQSGWRGPRPRRQPQDEQDGGEAERNIDEKNPSPAEVFGQKSADDRADGRGDRRHGRKIALVMAAFARRHDLADERLRQRHQPAAAQPLQDAGGREKRNRWRHRTQHRGDDEQGQRRKHQPPPAEHVAEIAVDRRSDRIGDEIGDHDPGDPLDLAERGGDRRQRARHDRLVDDRKAHRQHDRGKQREKARARRAECSRIGRFFDARRHFCPFADRRGTRRAACAAQQT